MLFGLTKNKGASRHLRDLSLSLSLLFLTHFLGDTFKRINRVMNLLFDLNTHNNHFFFSSICYGSMLVLCIIANHLLENNLRNFLRFFFVYSNTNKIHKHILALFLLTISIFINSPPFFLSYEFS